MSGPAPAGLTKRLQKSDRSRQARLLGDRLQDLLPTRRTEGWRWSDLRRALSELQWVEIPSEKEWSESAIDSVGFAADAGDTIAALAAGTAEGWYGSWQRPSLGGGYDNLPLFDELGEAGSLGGAIIREGEQRVIVQRLTPKGGLAAHTHDFLIEPGASLTRILIQSGEGVALQATHIRMSDLSTFRQFVLAEGASLSRIETHIEVNGEAAKIELNGVYLTSAKRHADLTSQVTLNAPAGEIRQLVRGVARKGGRGVFQGKFKVERAAQKTDAEMEHNALILEEGAEVFAKPELEIYADDVKCSHGNTAGQLDEAAIFYLRSRGIPEAEARAMITRAFLIEALPDWLDNEVRAEIETRIDAWLGGSYG